MFDDRHGGLAEVISCAPRRLRVDVVVVGHLLAVQLRCTCKSRRRIGRGVESGPLMGVLAITQDVLALPSNRHPLRKALTVGVGGDHVAHPRCNCDVVGRCMNECLGRELFALGERESTRCCGCDCVGIALWIDDNSYARMVFGGCTHHRRTADVDLLDAILL